MYIAAAAVCCVNNRYRITDGTVIWALSVHQDNTIDVSQRQNGIAFSVCTTASTNLVLDLDLCISMRFHDNFAAWSISLFDRLISVMNAGCPCTVKRSCAVALLCALRRCSDTNRLHMRKHSYRSDVIHMVYLVSRSVHCCIS